MPKMTSHRDLIVWQRGIELALQIRRLVRRFPRDERFRLEDQLRRAARSVPANVSEGFGRYSRPEFRRYLGYALGEVAEVDTHLEIAIRSHFCDESEARSCQKAYSELSWMLRRPKTSHQS
jgi:four helix bundle protein